MTDERHPCDPVPLGGPITQARVLRMHDTNAALETLAEFDECAPCRTVFAITLAAMGATVMLERDSNARMVLELQLAAVEAEIV